MNLPFQPPIAPMLAKAAERMPSGDEWQFEPKWDGFRTLVFRDGDEVLLQSRDLKPMNRYFPELIEPLCAGLPPRCVLDGEVVIAGPRGLDFDALLVRIHPAASRVKLLAAETPASFVAWDLLATGDEDLRAAPLRERRARLEEALSGARPPIHVTPITGDRARAEDWFRRFEGAGLDGVIAKRLGDPYRPGERSMVKVKHARTADCAVAGFRWHKGGEGTAVGSLLLGLHDQDGTLHHVGVASAFTATRRRELVTELAPLREGALEGHPWRDWARGPTTSGRSSPQMSNDDLRGGPTTSGRSSPQMSNDDLRGGPTTSGRSSPQMSNDDLRGEAAEAGQRLPGATSRWNRGKDLSWQPLRVERVCEVGYDHMQGARFRHPAQFKRWRPDRSPRDCTYEQLEVTPPFELQEIFGAPTS